MKLVIFDAHALLHRAFHALPRMTDSDGGPTNALYGFASMILNALGKIQPDYAVAAYDTPEKTFRHKTFAEYKETRPKTPDELEAQIERSKDLLATFGIRALSFPGYEADDVIGTLAKKLTTPSFAKASEDRHNSQLTTKERGKEKGEALEIIIVTGDLDTLQLVTDSVSVMTLKKGISETIRYFPKEVRERFGFEPTSVPDYKGLAGDSSDNIPGVKGIGEKTAKELIVQYAHLEDLYIALDKGGVPEKFAKKLRSEKENAFFSRNIASIVTDLPLTVSLDDLAYVPPATEVLQKTLLSFGFKTLAQRAGIVKTVPPAVSVSNPPPLAQKRDAAREELTLFSPSVISENAKQIFFVFGGNALTVSDGSSHRYTAAIDDLLALPPGTGKIGWGVKDLYRFCYDGGAQEPKNLFDVRLAGWLIRSNATKPTPEQLTKMFLAKQVTEGEDPIALLPDLYAVEKALLADHSLEKLFTEIEMPTLKVLAKMESLGIALNERKIAELKTLAGAELEGIEKKIRDVARTPINVASPAQLRWLLFEKLGIVPEKKAKKTKTGAVSTQENDLLKLVGTHPVVGEIIRWRSVSKILTTYTTSLLAARDRKTGAVHPVFEETGTVTGRITSENPALQNLPREGRWAENVLDAFEAREGYSFVAFDYSQIELRIAAHLSGDETLKDIFRSGADIHDYVARTVFKNAKERRRAKVLNFGILYGMGARSLSELTGFSVGEARQYISDYFARFPKVRAYRDETLAKAATLGYAETLSGRKRFLPELGNEWGYRAKNQAEREAINFPIQGTGADILKKAMVEIDKQFRASFPADVRPILTVHDELVFEVRDGIVSSVTDTIKHCMEESFPLSVPLLVSTRSGKTLIICRK